MKLLLYVSFRFLKERRKKLLSKILKFDLQSKDLQIKNILNQEFLNISIKAISSVYPNRNNSYFTPDAIRKAIPTCYDKPILAHYIPESNDFGAHEDNGIHYDEDNGNYYFDYTKNSEIPIGLIRQSDRVDVSEDKGLTWLNVTAAIWVQYNYKACKRLLKDRHKKVSVEIQVNSSYEDEKGIEVIEDFTLLGICILGSNISEGIPLASLDVTDLKDNPMFNKQFARLKFACDKLDKQTAINNNTFSDGSQISSSFESKPDFKDPVENEKVDEITMNDNENFEKGGNENVLTYEVRRGLIEAYLNKNKSTDSGPWLWVRDLTDSEVIYSDGTTNFKANYMIQSDEDGKSFAVVDTQNAVEVVISWTSEFSNTENAMDNEKDFKKEDCAQDTCPDCGKPMSECTCEEHKENQACEDGHKQDNACEDKQEECKDTQAENVCKECGKPMSECQCKMSEETECETLSAESESKEDNCDKMSAEDKEDNCDKMSENKEDNCNMSEENECKSFDDDDKDDDEDKDKDEDKNDDDDDDDKDDEDKDNKENHACEDKVDESCEDKETEESHIISPDTYAELLNKYEALESKYEELNKKYSAMVQNELLTYGCDAINNEPDLSEFNAKALTETFSAMCNEAKFSSKEDVDSYLNRSFADMLYAQRKEARKSEEKFSCDIHKDVKISGTSDSLKDVMKKLENL